MAASASPLRWPVIVVAVLVAAIVNGASASVCPNGPIALTVRVVAPSVTWVRLCVPVTQQDVHCSLEGRLCPEHRRFPRLGSPIGVMLRIGLGQRQLRARRGETGGAVELVHHRKTHSARLQHKVEDECLLQQRVCANLMPDQVAQQAIASRVHALHRHQLLSGHRLQQDAQKHLRHGRHSPVRVPLLQNPDELFQVLGLQGSTPAAKVDNGIFLRAFAPLLVLV
mmetsp:Transcript_104302/g.204595  ORF Transcript_104302/g.204595 Transcript_104302/m.204595 type:complete len:225 (-) Transcript_104302:169-843(-)